MKNPIGTLVRTGERCPESGIWFLQDEPNKTLHMYEGKIVPPNEEKNANWKLLSYI
ncbi:MAG: hypothetical protein Q4A28_04220 [Brachymonas sp.]|nr:hypothetical protein [Brachymonas sp.]